MICSICGKDRVTPSNWCFDKDADFKWNTSLQDGVAVCTSCYAEVNKVMAYMNEHRKDKSMYYGAGNDWAKRWIKEVTEEREGWIGRDKEAKEEREGWIAFLSELAIAAREGIYSDIQVKPRNGPSIRAHKFVLATRSDILKTMLESDSCKAAPGDCICLPEFNHEELEAFLEFLYQGDLAIEKFEKHFCSLMVAADKYDIPHLQSFSEKQLLKLLSSSIALKVLEISEAVSSETLKVAALKLIVLQYKEIVLLSSFDEFAKQNPHLVVQITRASLQREENMR